MKYSSHPETPTLKEFVESLEPWAQDHPLLCEARVLHVEGRERDETGRLKADVQGHLQYLDERAESGTDVDAELARILSQLAPRYEVIPGWSRSARRPVLTSDVA
jgi:hypothetical protein